MDSMQDIIKNIITRRDKSIAHNELKYYFFSEKAAKLFPIEIEKFQVLADTIFNFAYAIKNALDKTWLVSND